MSKQDLCLWAFGLLGGMKFVLDLVGKYLLPITESLFGQLEKSDSFKKWIQDPANRAAVEKLCQEEADNVKQVLEADAAKLAAPAVPPKP